MHTSTLCNCLTGYLFIFLAATVYYRFNDCTSGRGLKPLKWFLMLKYLRLCTFTCIWHLETCAGIHILLARKFSFNLATRRNLCAHLHAFLHTLWQQVPKFMFGAFFMPLNTNLKYWSKLTMCMDTLAKIELWNRKKRRNCAKMSVSTNNNDYQKMEAAILLRNIKQWKMWEKIWNRAESMGMNECGPWVNVRAHPYGLGHSAVWVLDWVIA